MREIKESERPRMTEIIRRNIVENGRHITLVTQFNNPRFAYTIGLSTIAGAEIMMLGAIIYDADDLYNILNLISERLQEYPQERTVDVGKLGTFRLIESHKSWNDEILLGALDYFRTDTVAALQVIPDPEHITIDVPDASLPWNPSEQPVWRWLKEPWAWPIPAGSAAVTNLAALRGEAVTEVSRWELDEWELFAGSGADINQNDLRVVPIATLVAADPSLFEVLSLDVGKSLWRNSNGDAWRMW